MGRRLSQLSEIPVTELKGIGPKAAASLERAFGITTVLDLLTHYPRRPIDRTRARVADLRAGEEGTVFGTVRTVERPHGRSRKTPVRVTVSDGSGWLQVAFFNQPWWATKLVPGSEVMMSGKVGWYRGRPQLTNPLVDLFGDQTGRVVAIYPQSPKERLTTRDIDGWMAEVLRRAGDFDEPVPAEIVRRHGLVERRQAFSQIHRPDSVAAWSSARARLVFDELLRLQLALVRRKLALEREAKGIEHRVGSGPAGEADLVASFLERLPFSLTGAQQRVIAEITADLIEPHPMHRLLQGDVGSGKTVVALAALLVAVQSGHQGALMAPTAVLAEQHFASVRALVEGFTIGDGGRSLFGERPLTVELLTNRTTPTERRRVLAALADGSVDVVVGTHALIQDAVAFASLGVAVIDEQHRFGVEQRSALRAKNAAGTMPDVLVMTATPIPRTAAMTVFGDLDVSVLDELPPGRKPVTTTWVRTEGTLEGSSAEEDVWIHVRAEVGSGRQVYVVCPLIEESEKLDAASAEETHARLSDGELKGLRVGLLHGRLPAAEKDLVMSLFRSGGLDVLVATTVIEVGVDVPNATVMVILGADHFGIAQLHQLRGRVGRGADESFCYLLGAGATPEARKRLEALVATSDGFELAEVDLDLRGEGTIMGERQKGRNDLKLASLRDDREWVLQARADAFALLRADPDLTEHPGLAEEVALFHPDDASTDYLLKS